ncbi:MAG: hypothetical protein AAGF73_15000 [Actinomycetota bacterium]
MRENVERRSVSPLQIIEAQYDWPSSRRSDQVLREFKENCGRLIGRDAWFATKIRETIDHAECGRHREVRHIGVLCTRCAERLSTEIDPLGDYLIDER